MKKVLAATLATILVLSTMSGCNTKPSSSSSNTTSTKDTLSGNLTIASWDYSKTQYLKDTASAFHQLHQNVNVTVLDITANDYISKVTVMLAGGDTTDIIDIKSMPQLETLVQQKRLDAMDPYITKSKLDMTPYNTLEASMMIDKKVYALPFRNDFWVLYYNKSLFDKAKVPYPTNDMTWTQYRDLAKKMTSGSGASKVYGTYTNTWASSTMDWAVAEGKGTMVDGNFDKFKPYYDTFLGLQTDGSVMSYATVKSQNSAYAGFFANQQCAMMLMGTWLMGTTITNLNSGNYNKFDWGIVNAPHSTGVKPGTTFGNATACAINVNSKNKDLAWEFTKWRCGEEGALLHAKNGNMPALKTQAAIDAIAAVKGMPTDANSLAALKPTSVALEFPVDPNADAINTMVTSMNELIMNGSVTLDKGLSDMKTQYDKIRAGS